MAINQASGSASAPVEALLARLEKVRRCGRGWMARCPAHEDKTASLSIGEGADGRVLLNCFGGCKAIDVVRAVGLELADLFSEKLADTSPAGRAARREAHQQAGWAAALRVLSRESTIVGIAGRRIAQGEALDVSDMERLQTALERIDGAREVLA